MLFVSLLLNLGRVEEMAIHKSRQLDSVEDEGVHVRSSSNFHLLKGYYWSLPLFKDWSRGICLSYYFLVMLEILISV